MRTTLTIDDDVLDKARALASKRKIPFRSVVNEALRAGLAHVEAPKKQKKYRTIPRPMNLRPGRNLDNIQEILSQVEGGKPTVILVDANILLYAEDSANPFHKRARPWWDEQLSGTDPVCLCRPVIDAFIRIGTNSRVFEHPLGVTQAISRVQSWLDQPCTRLICPTDRHWLILQEMLTSGQAAGNLVPDAHLAALALEHGCTLYSSDSDFSRFPRLKWRNPLAK